MKKMSLEQFVDTVVSKEMHSSIKGGLNIRHYLNNANYDVEIMGRGPYATYIDGFKESDNDTW